MTETALAATLSATPRAASLVQEKPGLKLDACHGVLTPVELDARAAETETLLHGAAIHDLGWLRAVRLRGEDRFRWLSGMVTNTVNDLKPGTGAWNLVLNAQGRIQGDLTVWRHDDQLSLEIAADQYEKLLAHFDHFIIMDDVELQPVEGVTAIGLTGPRAAETLQSIGISPLAEPLTQARFTVNAPGLSDPETHIFRRYGVLADHYALWGTVDLITRLWKQLLEAGAKPVGSSALEAYRIAEGIPVYGIDIAERDLPQETSQMRTLHFNKGCYLGQEIVERIRSRGNVHRHLRHLELNGPTPAPGTELTLDGAPAGAITSAAEFAGRRFALAMLRAEAEIRNLPLAYSSAEGAGTANILAAPPAF